MFIESKCTENSNYVSEAKRERNKIRNAELGDLILRLFISKGTNEEKEKVITTIERGLEKGNIKAGAVHLGKTKDGHRNITLKDIWYEEKNVEYCK